MTKLVAENITVRVTETTLVKDASLTLEPGELVAILGPNGAGKTSLLRAMLGLSEISSGNATLDGTRCHRMSPIDRARKVSYLPQQRPLAWPNIVRDIVSLGRYSHGAALGRLGEIDAAAVETALTSCDLGHLADRNADTLSGGELARVHFARAIAAEAPLLLADEPVAALDPRHQLNIAELLRRFVDGGGGAMVVLHEVALAARFADRLIWMRDGCIIAEGSPHATLNAEVMEEIYGVRAHIRFDEFGVDVRIQGSA